MYERTKHAGILYPYSREKYYVNELLSSSNGLVTDQTIINGDQSPF